MPPAKANAKTKTKRVNVRRPDVMETVQAEVEKHYRSEIVTKLKNNGGSLTIGNTTVRLAQQFGFATASNAPSTSPTPPGACSPTMTSTSSEKSSTTPR